MIEMTPIGVRAATLGQGPQATAEEWKRCCRGMKGAGTYMRSAVKNWKVPWTSEQRDAYERVASEWERLFAKCGRIYGSLSNKLRSRGCTLNYDDCTVECPSEAEAEAATAAVQKRAEAVIQASAAQKGAQAFISWCQLLERYREQQEAIEDLISSGTPIPGGIEVAEKELDRLEEQIDNAKEWLENIVRHLEEMGCTWDQEDCTVICGDQTWGPADFPLPVRPEPAVPTGEIRAFPSPRAPTVAVPAPQPVALIPQLVPGVPVLPTPTRPAQEAPIPFEVKIPGVPTPESPRPALSTRAGRAIGPFPSLQGLRRAD